MSVAVAPIDFAAYWYPGCGRPAGHVASADSRPWHPVWAAQYPSSRQLPMIRLLPAGPATGFVPVVHRVPPCVPSPAIGRSWLVPPPADERLGIAPARY